MSKLQPSLKHVFILFAIIITVVPLIVLYLSVSRLGATTTDIALKEIAEKTVLGARLLDQYISQQVTLARSHSHDSNLKSKDIKSINRYLDYILSENTNIDYIALYDTKNTLITLKGDQSLHHNSLKEVISSKKLLTNRDIYISEYKSSTLHNIVLSAPILKDEKIIYYISFSVNIDNIYYLLASMQESFSGVTSVKLINTEEKIILSVNEDGNVNRENETTYLKALDPRDDYTKVVKLHGKKYIVNTSYLSNFGVNNAIGWRLELSVDYNKIHQPLTNTLSSLLFNGVVIVIIALFISLYISRSILRPLIDMQIFTEQLSKGKLLKKLLYRSRYKEMILFANSLKDMAEQIKEHQKVLEKEISEKERTAKKVAELNMTLEKRVEEEVKKNREKDKYMIQQAKLAQMGEMISMIAHQWRQPLTAISATSTLIQMKISLGESTDDEIMKQSQKISKFSKHLSSTIDDFKNFFKPNKNKEQTTYTLLVDDVLEIVEKSLTNKNIELIKELKCEEFFTTYAGELKQVILNLIKNSEDILIEKDSQNTSPFIKIKSYSQDDQNILEIIDNGGGIKEDILEKIFDPYFSTKTAKNGTGLGLYMSKTIVEKHCGGKLTAQNTQDGALFRVILNKEENA